MPAGSSRAARPSAGSHAGHRPWPFWQACRASRSRHLGTGLDLPLQGPLEVIQSLVRGGLGFCRALPLVVELRLELRDPRLVAHALVVVQLALVLERGDVLERGS